MQPTTDRSLRELQRETEQTRAGLTHTVEQLKSSVTDTANEIRQRISPENIKAEVSDYVRSRGETMLEDITSAARRNPMQAVAVGASLAYPLLRFAKSIPLPILMVGAGLFFAGSKTGQSITQKASDMASDLSDDLSRRGHGLSAKAGETASSLSGPPNSCPPPPGWQFGEPGLSHWKVPRRLSQRHQRRRPSKN